MNIFPRKNKQSFESAYYFGDYDDKPLAPFSVSVATFDESHDGEAKHYHTQNQKVYITISGKAILDIDGKKIELNPQQMIQVEPNEVHFLEKVLEAPFMFVVVTSSKIDDKVIVE